MARCRITRRITLDRDGGEVVVELRRPRVRGIEPERQARPVLPVDVSRVEVVDALHGLALDVGDGRDVANRAAGGTDRVASGLGEVAEGARQPRQEILVPLHQGRRALGEGWPQEIGERAELEPEVAHPRAGSVISRRDRPARCERAVERHRPRQHRAVDTARARAPDHVHLHHATHGLQHLRVRAFGLRHPGPADAVDLMGDAAHPDSEAHAAVHHQGEANDLGVGQAGFIGHAETLRLSARTGSGHNDVLHQATATGALPPDDHPDRLGRPPPRSPTAGGATRSRTRSPCPARARTRRSRSGRRVGHG